MHKQTTQQANNTYRTQNTTNEHAYKQANRQTKHMNSQRKTSIFRHLLDGWGESKMRVRPSALEGDHKITKKSVATGGCAKRAKALGCCTQKHLARAPYKEASACSRERQYPNKNKSLATLRSEHNPPGFIVLQPRKEMRNPPNNYCKTKPLFESHIYIGNI